MSDKKSKESVSRALPDVDIDMAPLVWGVKSVVGVFFPSHDKNVRKEEKKLRDLKRRVELLRLQKEQGRVLRELEEVDK